ncbi:hypothetical protein CMI38_02725 [Candidatus Pacearchaeota archaeon]|nr:hypothetical protein [Candidatus Pacearchaeota archaeon]|tara:strand:+ start:178 stop:1977 length:1800 start_codon:yes stop_codon:yes gene_type:complete
MNLDEIHYDIDNQQRNLELAYAYLDKEGTPKWSKWKKFIDCDIKFKEKANNRTILPREIVLDIEEPERFDKILKDVKKEFEFYSAYKTGSKGYHIHLFFKKDLSSEEKLLVIEKYDCDKQKATNRCMIALENVPHWKTGKIKTLIESKEGINDAAKIEIIEIEDKEIIFTRRGQIESFWKEQPFFYDKNRIFWLWDDENKKWEISDEIDYLNSIQEILGVETIDTKIRNELIAGFKQIGRKHNPKDIKKYWVQFKDKIYDVKTGKSFDATPEYFITNPIPWNVGESEDTPTIDKYLDDWVKGQDPSWKDTLYEIIAYNISMDKFMQRIIALCGGGSNGKGTFIKLNYKFLGKGNYVSSEIKALSEDRFEASTIYRKLLCVMGEVGYGDLRNTNQLKKIAGEDKLSFQFKNKDSFTEDNTATGICLTNALPITPDKSKGFYRKWLIIDFLNQFNEINENLIDKIPDIEFNNLAKKCLRILKELYKNPKFTNEGDFDERTKRYEERSNPVMKFVEGQCEESPGAKISLRDFTNACNKYLIDNHLRVLNANQIGKILRDEGFIVVSRKIYEISSVVILNLKLITREEPLELSKPLQSQLDIT